ncbi:Rv1733c family protein [Streptomyces niveus]|uniref:Rv1733c family protein n=1 Tax=Streptomyces niveus TaxID=193462 RepID=UPI0035D7F9A6
MRAVVGLRRWRHNPLRRRTDLVEAWVALGALVLMFLAVPVIGWISGTATDDAFRRTIRAQHEDRHRTQARVVGLTTAPARVMYDPETSAERETGRPVIAKWTAPDGSRHTETVRSAPATVRAGDTFPVWTDRAGHLTKRPTDLTTARTHAVLAGIGAAAFAAGLVEAARRLVVRGLHQRRYTRLDLAWAQAGPDWGRTGAGS